MARHEKPTDPGDEPTRILNLGEAAGPPTAWYLKPAALISWGVLISLLIGVIVFGIVTLFTDNSAGSPATTTTTPARTTTTTPARTTTTTTTTTTPTRTTTTSPTPATTTPATTPPTAGTSPTSQVPEVSGPTETSQAPTTSAPGVATTTAPRPTETAEPPPGG